MRSRGVTWLRWLVVFAAAGIIYFLSDRPIPGILVIRIPQFDKLAHLLEYGAFTGLILRALWADEGRLVPVAVLILGAALAAAYGAGDEFHQSFVPGRDCSLYDWLADASGAAVAALLYTPLTRRFAWMR